MTTLRRTIAGLLTFLFLAVVPLRAWAQTWSGATDNNWTTPSNWVGGLIPPNAFTTTVVFDATGVSHTPDADVPWLLNRLELSGLPPYSLTGFQLGFDGAGPLISVTGPGHSIANPLGIFSTVTVNHTDDVIFSGSLAGAGGLTKNGASRLTLAGSSLPAGTLTISSGTVQLGDGANGPAAAFDIVNNGALETDLPGGMLVNGAVTGSGTVTVNGGILGQSPGPGFTHAGATTVNLGGQLDASVNNNALLTIATGGIFSTGGSTVGSLEGDGQLNINAGTFTVGGDDSSTTYTGGILGPGGLTKVGTGQLTLAGSSMTGGTITIASGTLTLGNGGALSGIGDIVNNATLETNAFAVSVNGTFSGTGTLTILGGLVAQLGPGFTYTGATNINAGGQLDASLDNLALLTIAFGGTMNTGGSTVGSLAGGGLLNINAGTFTVGGDNTSTTYSGNFSGLGALTKTGSGRLTLTGLAMPNGTVTIGSGTLRLGDGVTGPLFMFDVVNNSALETNRPGGLSVLGALSGTGTLTVLGGLLAQFGPAFTHAGATTVDSGGQLAAPTSAGPATT